MRRIVIVDYKAAWQAEYLQIAQLLGRTECVNVIRIDHIGSTSVPGLAAKDVIDVQVTVRDLDNPEHVQAFKAQDFVHIEQNTADALNGMDNGSPELRKQFFREPVKTKRTHIHVREQGRVNQRYALLFRDYLRANPVVCHSYETIKRQLAATYPDNIDGYLSVKDPVMDMIYAGAEQWASAVAWQPGRDHE